MKYYIVKKNIFNDYKFAYGEQEEENYNTGEAKLCPECGSIISMLEWLPPYKINVSKREIGDFIYGTFVGFIVSKNVKDKFEQSNLKGLSDFKKVVLFYKEKLLKEEYYYPNISLINAFVDLKKIEMEDINICHTCQTNGSIINRINGISFLYEKQIKNDIFFSTSIGQAHIILSENFKNFVNTENFTNIDLIKASKFKWDSMN